MAAQKIIHINAVKDGLLVKSPSEWVFELNGKIGKVGKDSKEGIGIALARIRKSEPHWHETTREYYFIVNGTGTATIGKQEMELKPLDWLEIPLKKVHRVESKLGMDVLAITVPPWTKEDHHIGQSRKQAAALV